MANSEPKKLEDEEELGGPKFSPPLYKQRYAAVIEVARKIQAKKVVDMGCAECKLLRQLKREPYIEELVGVDIDLLELNIRYSMVNPLTTDFLHPRERPLHFALMHGSIAEPDSRLVDFDLLSCVEVIEHLDPPVLEKVPYAIFGVLCPKMVVMTTPNSEFNVLFPGFTGFRHPDHRFEWTREQFQSWCLGVATSYSYVVEFGGVGEPPVGREGVGCCSQMATFTRSSAHIVKSEEIPKTYTIISEADHPYVTDVISPEEKLCREVEYYLTILLQQKRHSVAECKECSDDDDDSEVEADHVKIKLDKVLKFPKVRALCSSISEIKSSLLYSKSISLDATGQYAVFPLEPANSSSDSDSDSSTSSNGKTRLSSGSKFDDCEEDWDVDND